MQRSLVIDLLKPLLAGIAGLAVWAAGGAANEPVFLNAWGVAGAGPGQFNGPYAIAVANNGQVYVTDDGNNRVQRFDAEGNFQIQWGSAGAGDAQFDRPLGVGIGPTGQVYVLDAVNGRVQRFDADGNYQIQWGGGDLVAANGMAVGSDGLVYVARPTVDAVERFDAEGNPQGGWSTTHPLGLAVDGAGQVYVTDPVNHRMLRFDASGNLQTQWGSAGTGDGQFINVNSVAVSGANRVYVVDAALNRIQRFDADGIFEAKWGGPGSGAGQFAAPWGMAVSDTGLIYVADNNNNRVQRFFDYESWVAPASHAVPGSITFDSPFTLDDEKELAVGGAITLTYGGNLNVAGGVQTAGSVTADGGVLTVSGGELTAGALTVTPNSNILHHTGGTITIDGGSLSMYGDVFQLDGADGDDLPTLRLVHGATFARPTDMFNIGLAHAARLEIRSGSVVTASGAASSLGGPMGGVGEALVTGAGSIWNAGDDLYFGLGGAGVGYLTIDDGGRVTNVSGIMERGSATVTGVGSTWVNSGSLRVGDAHLTIEDGGSVTNGVAVIERGTATVTGADATWTNAGSLSVGSTGTGRLLIEDGGAVSNLAGYISGAESSSVTVTGAGSTWTNAGYLYVDGPRAAQLTIEDGGAVGNTRGYVGYNSQADNLVTVTGAGSTWTNLEYLFVGGGEYPARGELRIEDGGVASTNLNNHLGYQPGGSGVATITGAGSRWTGQELYIGVRGTGRLSIEDGGVVSSARGYIGWMSASDNLVTVSGNEAMWTSTEQIFVGGHLYAPGKGQLRIEDGGVVAAAGNINLGWYAGSVGTATVTGTGSRWAGQTMVVGSHGTGQLLVDKGGLVSANGSILLGEYVDGMGTATVTGTDSRWSGQGLYVGVAGRGELSIEDGGSVADTRGYVGYASQADNLVTVRGAGSTWTNAQYVFVGGFENPARGELRIEDGGVVVSDSNSHLGYQNGGTGIATVTGNGSRWTSSQLFVGVYGSGQLSIENGGAVANASYACVATFAGSTGSAVMSGPTARWDSGALVVGGHFSNGEGGTGVLTIADGGTVAVGADLTVWSHGTVNLSGGTLEVPEAANIHLQGGKFNYRGTLHDVNGADLFAGDALSTLLGGAHTLGYAQGFKVTGVTRLYDLLTLDGGEFSTDSLVNPALLRFNSGAFNLTGDDLAIGAGGLLGASLSLSAAKTVRVTHHAAVESAGELSLAGGRLAAGSLANAGVILGDGRIDAPLVNAAGGQVRGAPAGRLLVTGAGNANAGVIALGEGTVEFRQDLTNQASGLVSGRGELRVGGGLVNDGSLAFSGGLTDVHGDVANNAGGRIVVTGGSTTTFFDDVQTDGEFYVAESSAAVLLGDFAGAGGTIGGGTVYIEGDLRPGNSPATVAMDNDVVFGIGARLDLEIGGTAPGVEFDQLLVSGELTLGGALDVRLIDPGLGTGVFEPQAGDAFEILAAPGGLRGTFAIETLPAIKPGLEWLVDYETAANRVRLLVAPIFAGDANEDGVVDGGDLVVWTSGFGLAGDATHAEGDADGDLDVDGADFLAWQQQLGSRVTATAADAPVPEPAALVLAIMAAASAALLHRHRNSLTKTLGHCLH